MGLDTGNLKMPDWSVDQSLAFMDQAGIQTSILSVSAPGVDFATGSAANEMARRLNSHSAELVTQAPDRFGCFAILPQQNIDAALQEIQIAFDTLGADGVVMRPHVDGIYLGHAKFAPVLQELNRRQATMLLHPSELPGGAAFDIPAFMADFLLDTVRGAISLMRSGAMDLYPDINVILSHAGGFLPFIANRIAARVSPLGDAADGHRLMRQFYLDTSLSSSPTSLPSILEFADPGKILTGTDFLFAPTPRANEFLMALDQNPLVDHDAVNFANANKLFASQFPSGGSIRGNFEIARYPWLVLL